MKRRFLMIVLISSFCICLNAAFSADYLESHYNIITLTDRFYEDLEVKRPTFYTSILISKDYENEGSLYDYYTDSADSSYSSYPLQHGLSLYWEPFHWEKSFRLGMLMVSNKTDLNMADYFYDDSGKAALYGFLFGDGNLTVVLGYMEAINYSWDMWWTYEQTTQGLYGKGSYDGYSLTAVYAGTEDYYAALVKEFNLVLLDLRVDIEYMRQSRKMTYGIRMKDLELFGPMVIGGDLYFDNFFDEPSFRFSHAALSLQALFYRNKGVKNDFYISAGVNTAYWDSAVRGKIMDYTAGFTFMNLPGFFSKEGFFELAVGISGSKSIDGRNYYYLDENPFVFLDIKAWHDVLMAKELTPEEKERKKQEIIALNRSWTGNDLPYYDESDAVYIGNSFGIGTASALITAIWLGLSNEDLNDGRAVVTSACVGAGAALLSFVIQEAFFKGENK